jgi:hypothetical protein
VNSLNKFNKYKNQKVIAPIYQFITTKYHRFIKLFKKILHTDSQKLQKNKFQISYKKQFKIRKYKEKHKMFKNLKH